MAAISYEVTALDAAMRVVIQSELVANEPLPWEGGDPRVAAEYLAGYSAIEGGTPLTNRNVMALYIAGDEVVTTPAELAENYCAENSPVVTAATPLSFTPLEFVPTSQTTDPTGATFGLDLADRHGFLLNFVNPGLTVQAQDSASAFVATGHGPNGCLPSTASPCPQ